MSSISREGLAALYGKGRLTFYARFRRHSAEYEQRALLIEVMDENLRPLTDHLWTSLPRVPNVCNWALQPRTPLRLEATVGQYVKRTGETSYCFETVWTFDALPVFPIETPEFVQDCHAFLDTIISNPKERQRWRGLGGSLPLDDDFILY